jgi:hypothetical protein
MTLPDSYTPTVPDAPPETHEYIAVVILNGREHGRRESVDICSSYAAAVELGQLFAANVGRGATFAVLKRPVGPWEVVGQ